MSLSSVCAVPTPVVVQFLKIVRVAQRRAFRLVVAAVEKSFVIFRPGCSGKFHPLQSSERSLPVSTSRTCHSFQSDPEAAVP